MVGRTEGYTGILIDDLISKGADEPYRMFTSRAEYRLHLRIDNADERLTPLGRRAGLVTDARWSLFEKKAAQRAKLTRLLDEQRVDPAVFPNLGLSGDDRPTLGVWLKRPEARIDQIADWLVWQLGEPAAMGVLTTVETEAKYSGYIAQQQRQMERMKGVDGRRIPADLDYARIPGLSIEVRQKLTRVRPETLGQASRVPGVTPAAVAVLDVYLNVAR